jgi:hypothetical protein
MKKIFISYSHKDKKWKDLVDNYLKAASLEAELDVWDDDRISVGDYWKQEIETALNNASIALLLVSVDFLNSRFIRDFELPTIIQRREKEGLWVIPVILKDCPWKMNAWLKNIQAIPRDGKTLWQLKKTGRAERELTELVEKIVKKIHVVSTTSGPPKPVVKSDRHIKDENPFTDTHVILEPSRFIGRDEQMRRLSQMLEHGCVSLQGERKIGKSSLLLHLVRTRNHSPVIGPIDVMGINNADDFYQQLGKPLGVKDGDRIGIRDTLKEFDGLVLVDELDYGQAKGITSDDIGIFRAICQVNRKLKMAAVSMQPLSSLFPDSPGSWVYDFLLPLTIKELNEEESRLLLTHPWAPEAQKFDSKTCRELLEVAGLHPYKLQRSAHYRFKVFQDPHYNWQKEFKAEMEQLL